MKNPIIKASVILSPCDSFDLKYFTELFYEPPFESRTVS